MYTPYTNNDCSGARGCSSTLNNALSVTTPATNPNLAERCGINLMLVLDESGSIGSTSGATAAVRTATKAFLGALSGTGSQVSIIDFSTSAARPIGYTTVTPESIAQTFNPYIDNTNPATATTPAAGRTGRPRSMKVGEANGEGTKADLVVFMTDGDPTARNNAAGRPDHGAHRGRRDGTATGGARGEQGQAPGVAHLRAGRRRGGEQSPGAPTG